MDHNCLQNLPPEIILYIFSFLDVKQLCRCARVSAHLRKISEDPSLWTTLDLRLTCITHFPLFMNQMRQHYMSTITRIISDQSLDTASLKIAKQCFKLKFLDISYKAHCNLCGATDKDITEIAKQCTLLQHLNVKNQVKLTDESISEVIKRCTRLDYLNVSGLNTIGDDCILLCKQLRYLNIRDTKVTDVGIISIAKKCPQIQQLYISKGSVYNSQVSDTSILEVAKNCHLLTHISIINCNITDKSVLAIATFCLKLQFVDFKNSSLLTDAAICKLVQQCPSIKRLEISYCTNVTDTSIAQIGTHSRQLEHLDVAYCKVTESGINTIIQQCLKLKNLNAEFRRLSEDDFKKMRHE